MTTTAFQVIFDRAESIVIDKRAITAQTVSRNQTTRAVSRGGQIWRFDIKMPDGMPWSEMRPYIEAIESADRYTVGTVQINNAGYNSWFMPYLGNSVSTTGFVANVTQGWANASIFAAPSTISGYRFRAGDLVQVGTGNVYTVSTDVAYNSANVTFNRPVKDSTGSYALTVGPACTFRVICTALPTWEIFARNQVRWNGSFTFFEATE
jgi:hypothetical protein